MEDIWCKRFFSLTLICHITWSCQVGSCQWYLCHNGNQPCISWLYNTAKGHRYIFFFSSILPDFSPFLPFFFKRKKSLSYEQWLNHREPSTKPRFLICALCGWIREPVIGKPLDENERELFYHFLLARLSLWYFSSTKLRKFKILFVESPFSDWFSLSLYHWNGAVSEVIFQLKTRINKWINLQSLWHVLGLLAAQTMMGGKRKMSENLSVHWGRVWGQILLPLTLFSLCWRIWWWNLATCSQFYTWAVVYLCLNSELQVHGTVTAKLCIPVGSFCSWAKKVISPAANQEIPLGRGSCQ